VLLPDPASFRVLPWAPGTGWMRAETWFDDATPVPIDTRRILAARSAASPEAGYGLTCGLEVEFHIYRLADALAMRRRSTRSAPPGRASRRR
jgi:glutamine synthetase